MKEKDRDALAEELDHLAQSEKEAELQKEPDKAPPPPPKPYNVFGTNLTVTKAEYITYQKYRMKTMKMKYKLVGHVDENGQYVIPDPIRRDLVNMEKEIEDQTETYYKAIALYMKKHFYYSVRLQSLGNGNAKASLYLSEFVDDFLGHEFIVSHVADFEGTDDDEFRIKLRKAFHLVDVATKVDDFAVPELAVIMQDAFDFELIAGGLYDMASQIYLMKMLKELEEGGDLCKEVLAKYRELLNGKNIEIDEKFRYTSYKALLDRIIDEYGGFEGIGLDPVKVAAIVRDMNKTLYQVDQASMRGPLEMQSKSVDPKKVTAEKKAGKKPAAKKPEEKKPEKKPEKKKDDKAKTEEKKPSSASSTGKKLMIQIEDGVKIANEFLASLSDTLTPILKEAILTRPVETEAGNNPTWDINQQIDTGAGSTNTGTKNEALFNPEDGASAVTEASDKTAVAEKAQEKMAAAEKKPMEMENLYSVQQEKGSASSYFENDTFNDLL